MMKELIILKDIPGFIAGYKQEVDPQGTLHNKELDCIYRIPLLVTNGFAGWVEEEKRCESTTLRINTNYPGLSGYYRCGLCGQVWSESAPAPICKGKKEESKYESPYRVKHYLSEPGYFVERKFDIEQEANKYKEYCDAWDIVRSWADKVNGDWKPDWSGDYDNDDRKYYVVYLHSTDTLSVTSDVYLQLFNTAYLRTRELAEESARIHEKQYKIFAGITDENDDNVNMTYEWVKGRDTSKWL